MKEKLFGVIGYVMRPTKAFKLATLPKMSLDFASDMAGFLALFPGMVLL